MGTSSQVLTSLQTYTIIIIGERQEMIKHEAFQGPKNCFRPASLLSKREDEG